MKEAPFKICPKCGTSWDTLEDFLSEASVKLKGYQVNFEDLKEGLFYFEHQSPDCGTTMGITIYRFKELSNLPFLAPSLVSRPDDCPGLCLNQHELGECPVLCNCNWVRDIMRTIRQWHKATA